MLEAALGYWRAADAEIGERASASTISRPTKCSARWAPDGYFREDTPYAPNSPYSASKAASDHLVRAWRHTYGLPTVLTNCSNNYGPYHFPEKLIPLMILNALEGKPLPVYGRGENVRDWLHVEDHAEALLTVVEQGQAGRELQYRRPRRAPQPRGRARRSAISSTNSRRARGAVAARPHRLRRRPARPRPALRHRRAQDRARARLAAARDFESGLRETVRWYLDNEPWWAAIRSGAYRGERLGVAVLNARACDAGRRHRALPA